MLCGDPAFFDLEMGTRTVKVDLVLVAMGEKTEYTDYFNLSVSHYYSSLTRPNRDEYLRYISYYVKYTRLDQKKPVDKKNINVQF